MVVWQAISAFTIAIKMLCPQEKIDHYQVEKVAQHFGLPGSGFH
jgi:hypothetical protein